MWYCGKQAWPPSRRPLPVVARGAEPKTSTYFFSCRRFDCLDKDGSGEIDSSELSHPLLCTGLARSALEVGHLVSILGPGGLSSEGPYRSPSRGSSMFFFMDVVWASMYCSRSSHCFLPCR